MTKSYRVLIGLLLLAGVLVSGVVSFAQDVYEIFSIPHLDAVVGAAWNNDQTRIASWALDGSLKVSDGATGAEVFTVQFNDAIIGAIWNGDSTRVLGWSLDSTARIIDAATGDILVTVTNNDATTGAVWNGDESVFMTWSADGVAGLWNAETGEAVAAIQHADILNGASFNGDYSKIMTYAADGTITISSFADGAVTTDLTMQNDSGVLGAAWNAQYDRIVSWRDDSGDVVVWDTTTGQQVAILSHAGQATGAVWGTSVNRILTWSEDTSARIWQSGAAPILLGHDTAVQWAAFSPDESQVITLAESKVTIWDAATGDMVQEFDYGGLGVPGGVALSHSGLQLATWGEDGIVRIWDVRSGLLIVSYDPGTLAGPARGALWNADDTVIMSWGDDSMVHMWDFTIAPTF